MRNDGRELKEVSDEHDLLRARRSLGRDDHADDALEQVDSAHRDLIYDDDLGALKHLVWKAYSRVGIAEVGGNAKRPVDRRAFSQVERRDTRRGHCENLLVLALAVTDEGLQDIGLACAGLPRQEDVLAIHQRLIGATLVLSEGLDVDVCH